MINVVILAAGYATRLYPLTENFPKPLLEVGGRTILDRLLDDLDKEPEIASITVVTNHRFEGIFRDWAKKRMNDCCQTCGIEQGTTSHPQNCPMKPIEVVDDGTTDNDNRLGAVRDMLLAVSGLDHVNDVLVMAGDNVLDFDIVDFVRFAKEKNTSCVMCHTEEDLKRQQKTAIITVDASDKITSYEEKPRQPKGNLAVPPFYFYKQADIQRIEEALKDGCSADAPGSFAAWLSGRVPMHAFLMPGRRYDVGDLAGYRQIQSLFADET